MATGPRYAVRFRRRREGKTDYKKRLAMLKSGKTRFVVRVSNKQITCQFVKYFEAGDKTVISVNSSELKNHGWKHSCKNMPAAYLCGILAGKLAKEKKVGTVVMDIGLQSKKRSKLFAVAKGAVDAGLDLKVDEKVYPKEERVAGAHINEQIQKDFKATKEKIMKK